MLLSVFSVYALRNRGSKLIPSGVDLMHLSARNPSRTPPNYSATRLEVKVGESPAPTPPVPAPGSPVELPWTRLASGKLEQGAVRSPLLTCSFSSYRQMTNLLRPKYTGNPTYTLYVIPCVWLSQTKQSTRFRKGRTFMASALRSRARPLALRQKECLLCWYAGSL